MNLWWLSVFAVSMVDGDADTDRDARWLLEMGTVTKVVEDRHTVTDIIPSSCVVVAQSLLPCRQIGTPPSISKQIVQTRTASLDDLPDEEMFTSTDGSESKMVEPTETLGWGDYLGLRRTTVTNTVAHSETIIVHDPNVIVTFSVVGCQPSQLPFDLPYCKINTLMSKP